MNEHAPLELSGLVGSSPIGALAAFGLLRICSEIPELRDARLSWVSRDDWVAALLVTQKNGQDDLVDRLVKYLSARQMDVFNWSKDIRVAPDDFRARLIDKAMSSTVSERTEADYFSAFGSEMVVDGSKGLVKPTAFYMTSGQQKFLDSVNDLVTKLKVNSSESIREALFGPWRYNDNQHSLGWDPITERMYALRHRAPTSEAATSVRAAVWLAVEALPLFSTGVRNGGRLSTTSFSSENNQNVFAWPIWTDPVGLDGLRSLLATSELYGRRKDYKKLCRRGVAAVYQSARSEFGQGYAIFRPATRVDSI